MERDSVSGSDSRRRTSLPNIEEKENRPLTSESKNNLPYPSFSKAHSKEAVGSRPALNVLTPESTDVNGDKSRTPTRPSRKTNAPPSPPLTQVDEKTSTPRRTSARPPEVETVLEEEREKITTSEPKITFNLRQKSPNSGHLRSTSEVGLNGSPVKGAKLKPSASVRNKSIDEVSTPQRSVSQPSRTVSPGPSFNDTPAETSLSSNATSVAPNQPDMQIPVSLSKTPIQVIQDHTLPLSREQTPLEVFIEHERISASNTPGYGAPPPPPPPPPAVSLTVPKVDYLLKNGGLNQPVPKHLLVAGKPITVQQGAATIPQSPIVVANLFQPYTQLLDDFDKVLTKNGSLAVATGYRSVARRLLDRLEAVFARDLSSEECQCCMCEPELQDSEDLRGISWGEILELVSGRKDLPNWPAFTITQSPVGLGISLETHVPMQKLDVDVPEEYRDHYVKQSKKTKQSVDKWLSRQTDSPSAPPEEVDDETLTFAILTHLPQHQRQIFSSLLGININGPIEPPNRAPSPQRGPTPQHNQQPPTKPRPQAIITATAAIQRLYRLSSSPRDPETAIFLLNNPDLHHPLATLAAISSDEWEILTSGRFDGFLRSGAEDESTQSQPQPQNTHKYPPPTSRGSTPFNAHLANVQALHPNGHTRKNSWPSRPASAAPPSHHHPGNAGPIAFDEETEIATLAEIERDIFLSMEALEDAFETLHARAESVRKTLRERGAGLAAAAQRRRGGGAGVEVRLGTPAVNGEDEIHVGRWDGYGYGYGYYGAADVNNNNNNDDGLGDWEGRSELAPDDSASNVSFSSNRRRRPKRRDERRTPAIQEEDFDGAGEVEGGAGFEEGDSEGTASPVKR